MAKKTGEKETVGKANGFEVPIDEESAGKVLDSIYRSALNGVPKVSRSVDEMVADYTGKAKSPDDAARALAKWQIMKCGTSGFVTGLGGLITLPVAIPANIGSVIYVQVRMIACIAKMGGYDVTSDQVQTMVYMCLTGTTASDLVKMGLIKTGTKSLDQPEGRLQIYHEVRRERHHQPRENAAPRRRRDWRRRGRGIDEHYC